MHINQMKTLGQDKIALKSYMKCNLWGCGCIRMFLDNKFRKGSISKAINWKKSTINLMRTIPHLADTRIVKADPQNKNLNYENIQLNNEVANKHILRLISLF